MKKQISGAKHSDSFGVSNNDEPVLRTRYDDRIKALEEDLDRLTLRFTELHPDVVETKALLEKLETSRDEEIAAFLNADENDQSQPLSELTQIKLEVSRLESQIASLKVKETDIQNKIAGLESKVDHPQIEAESTALNREYGVTKQKYEELYQDVRRPIYPEELTCLLKIYSSELLSPLYCPSALLAPIG